MPRFRITREGAAEFLAPSVADAKELVFYNPLMRLNRDLAVAVANLAAASTRQFTIGDPMTGCGVRAIRYALEVKDPGIRVYAGDANKHAVSLANRNVRRNCVARKVSVEYADANALLTSHGRPKDRFNLIDLDPFGSPSPFFDSAARAIQNDGIVAATATDTALLCGARPAACIRKYGVRPLRTEYSHELGIRIMLGALAMVAGRHDVGLQPLLAHRTAHYLRLYARAKRKASVVNSAISQLGFLSHCFQCLDRGLVRRQSELPKNCPTCGKQVSTTGPIWIGPIFDGEFSQRLLGTVLSDKSATTNVELCSLVSDVLDESTAPPLYFVVDSVCDKYGLPMPKPELVIRALRERGYAAERTHFRSNGIRTNSMLPEFLGLLRELVPRS